MCFTVDKWHWTVPRTVGEWHGQRAWQGARATSNSTVHFLLLLRLWLTSQHTYKPFPFKVGKPIEIISDDVMVLASWASYYDNTVMVSQFGDPLRWSRGAHLLMQNGLRAGHSLRTSENWTYCGRPKAIQSSIILKLPYTCTPADNVSIVCYR